jgi:hypothetical protein
MMLTTLFIPDDDDVVNLPNMELKSETGRPDGSFWMPHCDGLGQ